MYKVAYNLNSGSLRFKAFPTLHDAIEFANKQPIDSVLEIKYYDDVDHRKSDRN